VELLYQIVLHLKHELLGRGGLLKLPDQDVLQGGESLLAVLGIVVGKLMKNGGKLVRHSMTRASRRRGLTCGQNNKCKNDKTEMLNLHDVLLVANECLCAGYDNTHNTIRRMNAV